MFQRNDDFNLLFASDSYKCTHWPQYPKDTQGIYSYFESRGGQFDSTIFFGLQYIMRRYLEGVVVTQEKIDEAEATIKPHVGHFNREGWEYIVREHGGQLPIQIKAVDEGTDVETRNVLMAIQNTDLDSPTPAYWLPNYLETLLVQTWAPTTVATYSNRFRRMLLRYLHKTSESTEGVDYMLHDFGCRGVTCMEQAGLLGAAHLVNFQGTDTLPALRLLKEYYVSDADFATPGLSIPASEHSTITAWGKGREVDAFRNMLTQYPTGLVACVSDSWDIFHACEDLWGKELRTEVLNRDGVLVIRPDSGYPPSVVVKCLEILGRKFGFQSNAKGYKVLNPHVRLIQGDGIDLEMAEAVLTAMMTAGWSAENIAFGSGGGLLQKHNRDTQQFAFKCSAIRIGGEWRPVWKDPVTDPGKVSKRGKLALSRDHGKYITVPEAEGPVPAHLHTVFENGRVTGLSTLKDIRGRVHAAAG